MENTLTTSPRKISAIVAVLSSTILAAACSSIAARDEHVAPNAVPASGKALILRQGEGERLIHRPPPGSLFNLTAPLILKVDRRTEKRRNSSC